MARVTNMPDGIGHPPVWIWDVDAPVGPGKANGRVDVGLVQACLNRLIRAKGLRDERKPFNPGPEDPLLGRVHGHPLLDFLEVDGWFGSETAYTIVAYQKATKFCVVDGVVSPVWPVVARGGDGSVADVVRRTLYQLNFEILQNDKTMLTTAGLPPFLVAALSKL